MVPHSSYQLIKPENKFNCWNILPLNVVNILWCTSYMQSIVPGNGNRYKQDRCVLLTSRILAKEAVKQAFTRKSYDRENIACDETA